MKTISGADKASFFLRKGLYELAHHRPARALVFLRKSVELIPPSCESDLSKTLYWLSIALIRLDQRDLAVKSLASAQKLRRQSYARKFNVRNVNAYGMFKAPTNESMNDAFVSIQLYRICSSVRIHRFGSEANFPLCSS